YRMGGAKGSFCERVTNCGVLAARICIFFLFLQFSYLKTIMAIIGWSSFRIIPSTSFSIFWLILLQGLSKTKAAGVIKFKLIEFECNGTLNDGSCCGSGHNESKCICEVYVYVCLGVGSGLHKSHRDCALIHHTSPVIAGNKLLNAYAVDIPFDVRWPLKNVSSTVEMRQWSNKAVIMRSERFIQLSPLDSENITIKEIDSSRKIVYEMQIECAEFYYGPQCARFCQPNIANVHFYCSPSGERLCMKGWTGRNCDDPICGKGCGNGFCVAPDTCRCRRGWQGKLCDQCRMLEGCKHGYCVRANECICEKNWGGTFCDRDLDYCYHNSPCQNGGKCSSGGFQNYYYCNCTLGFTGRNCEVEVDPCTQIDCGRFGKCLLVNREEHRVECDCDAEHYGTRCEHKVNENDIVEKRVVHRPTMSSCKLSENDYIPNGFSWTTIDCRQCICSKGLISCTETRCEPRDCLRNDPSTGAAVTCPEHQHCASINDGDCLKEPCIFPRGQCLSWEHINKEPSTIVCYQRMLDGRRNTFGCASMIIEFDMDKLATGTAVEDVCHHLLLDITTGNMHNIGFDCSRRDETSVAVEIISLMFTSDVTIAKDFLKSRIRDRLTASAVLNAALRVGDYDANEQIVWERRTLKGATSIERGNVDWLNTKHMLTVIVCLMMLIVIILLNICILKYPGSCFRKARNNTEIEASDCIPPRIYCTQPIIRNDKIKRSSRDRSLRGLDHFTSDLPFLQKNSMRRCSIGSTDSGIADKEQEDNEKNARLLDAHLNDTTDTQQFPYRFEKRKQSSIFRASNTSCSRSSSCLAQL
uniref:Delta-like protein n=1 Tax=Parascaris univalens TaxID=6257 RepID=A0A915BQK8_PARUN